MGSPHMLCMQLRAYDVCLCMIFEALMHDMSLVVNACYAKCIMDE
jgi:hypothetical protein